MYDFHCDALESEHDGVLFNQEQPLVCLQCSHTTSSNCDCEIVQKNNRVGHSRTKVFENKTKQKPNYSLCSNYPNGSSHSTFTQHRQCLSSELTIMKSILKVKTNNPRIPRPFPSSVVVTEDLSAPKSRCEEPQPTHDAVGKKDP